MSVHSNHNRWLVLMLCQWATKNSVLTLFNLTSVFIFSALSSLISYGADKENLFVNQELLNLVITAFILMTFMFDSRVLLWGEIRSQLPLGLRLQNRFNKFFNFFKKHPLETFLLIWEKQQNLYDRVNWAMNRHNTMKNFIPTLNIPSLTFVNFVFHSIDWNWTWCHAIGENFSADKNSSWERTILCNTGENSKLHWINHQKQVHLIGFYY